MMHYSERAGIAASFALSLALNSALFISTSQSLGSEKRWQRPKALAAAFQKARKIELEFVEAPPQKPLRKPEPSKKIAASDTLAQDRAPLKNRAALAPAIPKIGPADQLAQRRLEDQLVRPLRPKAVKAEPTIPKEKPLISDDSKSWLPVKSATTEKKVTDPAAEQAENEALEQAAAMMTSRDKITTMEMAVKRSSGAPFKGVTSFEATGSGMGSYMKSLKDRVWLAWFPYVAFRYPVDFRTSDAVIQFTIGRQGEVKRAEVIDYSGSPMFATFCLEAIRRTRGFGALPKDLLAMMGKDELEIKFAFHYR